MTDVSPATTVGDVVARDLRSASIFASRGIDFCCGGRRSIEDACRAAGHDPELLLRDLAALDRADGTPDDISTWPLERVIDRILEQHHAYVKREIPIIAAYLAKLVTKKSANHPELPRVQEIFAGLAGELLHHMEKEEAILFPSIRAIAAAHSSGAPLPRLPFGSVQNPVRMMEAEHQQAGGDMWELRTLTGGFQPPAEGCVTWRACYAELAAFERNLHEHVHLENNVLFPAAARLEEELS